MNRFFSKLDLRDIKISPQGSSFPPDEEAYQEVMPTADDGTGVLAVDGSADKAPEAYPWVARDPMAGAAAFVQDGATTNEGPEAGAALLDQDGARNGEVLKVSGKSRPSAVAGAIAGVVRECGRAEVQAIGAGATNQAVKAVAIARDYLRETGIEAVCLPAFIDVTIDNEDRTAIRLVVEPR
jgi:stage V sporulation protein S